jgi:A/G-specific adenine glycosylase
MQELIPPAASAETIVSIQEVAVVIQHRGDVLLMQRPHEGRWAGLWEFPHSPLEPNETHEDAALRIAQQLAGLRIDLGKEIATLRHAITRYRITMTCFEASHAAGKFVSAYYPQARWMKPSRLDGYPISSPQRRLALILNRPVRQGSLF